MSAKHVKDVGDVDARDEIRAAIIFYEKRGWCWLNVVAFISAQATGHWQSTLRK